MLMDPGILVKAYGLGPFTTPGTVTSQADPGVIIFSIPGLFAGKLTVYGPAGFLNPNTPNQFPSQNIDLSQSKLEVQIGNLIATYMLNGSVQAQGPVPIPEPGSILLVLGGLGAMYWKVRRARA